MRWYIRAAVLAAVLTMPSGGVAAVRPAVSPAAEHEDYTAFYAGRKQVDARLVRVQRVKDRARDRTSFRFIYRCRAVDGNVRHCRDRFVVRNDDACTRNATTNEFSSERTTVRGAPADVRRGDVRPQLVIYAGKTSISVSASSRRRAIGVAMALRSANRIITRRTQLPAASTEILTGEQDCSRMPIRPFEVMGEIRGEPKTDGARWAAWLDADSGATVLYDESRDVLESVATPDRCVSIAAVGGDSLVWLCHRPETSFPYWLRLDLQTRQQEPVQREYGSCVSFASGESLRDVGTHWVHFFERGYHNSANCYYNRETGALETDGHVDSPPSGYTRVVPDLSSPELWQPLCRPLSRHARGGYSLENGPAFSPYSFDGTFGVGLLGDFGPVVLDRCGVRDSVALDECQEPCGGPQLGGRLVTWGEREQVAIVDLETAWRARWSPPAEYRFYPGPGASAHTRRHVFASVSRDGETQLLAVAPVPGRED